jgi:hypothetical protein
MPNVIQCTTLGNFGRFGNQLWQYAFAKSYANATNSELQIPSDWIGRKLFKEINDPPISSWLPMTQLDQVPWGETNVDLYGYFQGKEFHSFLNADEVRKWFTFKDEWVERYRHTGEPYVALHMRRGDYLNIKHVFCVISDQSFYDAAEKSPYGNLPLAIMTEENPTPCPHAEAMGAGYLPDFFKLMNATAVFRSNSTFSWWAPFLANNKVYSPVVGNMVGDQYVPFVEGNHPKIFPGHTEDIYIKGYNA